MNARSAAAIAAVYVVAALVVTWPLGINFTDRIGALQGPGDPFLNLWILGWGLRAWTTDPASVFTGNVFNANIFFPAEGTLAYSDHFLLQALVLAPLYLATGDAVLCYNVLVVGSIAASGIAMHILARAITGSTLGAFAAGLAWACWPYRVAHLLHIQLQALYFMPLALLWLHRLVAGRRWRDVLGLSLFAGLQALASTYYGLMTAVALGVSALTLAIATGQWRSRQLWTRLAAAAALAIVLTAPVLMPYLRSQQAEGFGRTMFEAANHSAAIESYTQVPDVNLVYGTTGLLDPRVPAPGARDRRSVEHQMFPGLVVIALAIFGLFRGWRSDSFPVTFSAVALVVTGLVLSLGPEGWRWLYAALHDNVFGFQAIRAPARFAVIAFLGAVLLGALGISRTGDAHVAPTVDLRARALARAIGPIVLALMMLEYVNAPLPLAAAPPRQTPIGQWLKNEPTPGAVLHLPLTFDIENTPFMVQSLEHGRPIVNGYSGQRPAFYSALVDSLADISSAEALAALRELEVRFVVSESTIAGAGNATSPLVERARFDATEARKHGELISGVVYEVRWTPAAVAALNENNAPPPPAPGPAPFSPGERAVYDVYWEGGPMNIAAGRATLEVAIGESDAIPWTFRAAAETADWVSNFFQARDRLQTTADDMLQPIEHRREIREGRRQLDRTYVYDRSARVVRMGDMRIPLDVSARDALTAFYYVRTLPLAPGTVTMVPINEAGNPLVLQVGAGEVEQIDYRGTRMNARRLAPRLMRRIERRRPIALTVWLSDDDRRIPLRVVVEAGFGRVRLDLVDYRR